MSIDSFTVEFEDLMDRMEAAGYDPLDMVMSYARGFVEGVESQQDPEVESYAREKGLQAGVTYGFEDGMNLVMLIVEDDGMSGTIH